tara:strand:- start:9226 stop:10284 length:1059 start_codon:yes stop_codon:yes gene_type:complete
MIDNFKIRLFFLSMIIILFILLIVGVSFGPVNISFYDIFIIISHQFGFLDKVSVDSVNEIVLLNIRLPRVILGALVGLALGTSGAILQGLFRNPLVDPGFIGVSSGAAVGAMFAILFTQFLQLIFWSVLVPFILPIMAIIGSFITTILVYKMSKVSGKTNIMTMLLSGIAVNAISGSVIGLFVSISSDVQLRSFTFWTLGGLDNADWLVVFLTSIFVFIPLIIVFKMRDELDIFMLGDSEAHHLGLNVESLKKKIILMSSVMVGISVSFCGMIGFIGLVTPHLVRLFIGPKHKLLIPGAALLGAIILSLSDLIAKSIIAPAQLPLGVITSAIGAPFFIWLIVNQKKRFSYGE